MDNQVDLANNPDGSGLYDWKGTVGKVRVKLPIKFLDVGLYCFRDFKWEFNIYALNIDTCCIHLRSFTTL